MKRLFVTFVQASLTAGGASLLERRGWADREILWSITAFLAVSALARLAIGSRRTVIGDPTPPVRGKAAVSGS